MNLFYEDYPMSIKVCGDYIPIVTDFREYIKLLDMLNDTDISREEKAYFLSQYFLKEPSDYEQAIDELSSFIAMDQIKTAGIRGNQTEPKKEKPKFSFEIDYPYILSGFLSDYKIDLSNIKYLHWWKFRFLFDGLSADTEIKQRIMYRSIDLKTIKSKEEKKRIIKIQNSIRLPEEALTDFEIGDVFA